MAGGFAAYGFAADSRSSSLKQTGCPENGLFSNTPSDIGLKKPFFRPMPCKAFTLDLTIVRFSGGRVNPSLAYESS
jgi:hypothetical protein